MLDAPHAVVGAAIAASIPNPYIGIPLAFASHFVLDKVPHWNPHLNTETEKYGKPTRRSTQIVILDTSLALLAGFFIASRALPNTAHAITILASCFAASLPDIVEGPYFFLNMRHELIKRWIKFQKSLQSDTSIVPGLLTQIITIVAAFWWIFN